MNSINEVLLDNLQKELKVELKKSPVNGNRVSNLSMQIRAIKILIKKERKV